MNRASKLVPPGTGPSPGASESQNQKDEVNINNVTEMARLKLASLGKNIPRKSEFKISDMGVEHQIDLKLMKVEQDYKKVKGDKTYQKSARQGSMPQGIQGVTSAKKNQNRKPGGIDSKLGNVIKQKQPRPETQSTLGLYNTSNKKQNVISNSASKQRPGTSYLTAQKQNLSSNKKETNQSISPMKSKTNMVKKLDIPKQQDKSKSRAMSSSRVPKTSTLALAAPKKNKGQDFPKNTLTVPVSPKENPKSLSGSLMKKTKVVNKVSDRLFNNSSQRLSVLQQQKERKSVRMSMLNFAKTEQTDQTEPDERLSEQIEKAKPYGSGSKGSPVKKPNHLGDSNYKNAMKYQALSGSQSYRIVEPNKVIEPKKIGTNRPISKSNKQTTSSSKKVKQNNQIPLNSARPNTALSKNLNQNNEFSLQTPVRQSRNVRQSSTGLKKSYAKHAHMCSITKTRVESQEPIEPKKLEAEFVPKEPKVVEIDLNQNSEKRSSINSEPRNKSLSKSLRRSSVNPFLEGLSISPNKENETKPVDVKVLSAPGSRANSIQRNSNTNSIEKNTKEIEKDWHVKQGFLNKYKNFKNQFDSVIKYNQFNDEQLSRDNFIKVLVDLGFVFQEKLPLNYLKEYCWNQPSVKLLWGILTKTQEQATKTVAKNDMFTILAAILDCQVPEMTVSEDEQISPTQNPLFHRNQDNKIKFQNYEDLQKFSIKFKNIQNGFNENEEVRNENIEALRKYYDCTGEHEPPKPERKLGYSGRFKPSNFAFGQKSRKSAKQDVPKYNLADIKANCDETCRNTVAVGIGSEKQTLDNFINEKANIGINQIEEKSDATLSNNDEDPPKELTNPPQIHKQSQGQGQGQQTSPIKVTNNTRLKRPTKIQSKIGPQRNSAMPQLKPGLAGKQKEESKILKDENRTRRATLIPQTEPKWVSVSHQVLQEIEDQLHDSNINKKCNKNVLENHKLNCLNYCNINDDGLIKNFYDQNKIVYLAKVTIDGKKCAYKGQVDNDSKIPNGLGVAVDEKGNLIEGMFEDGKKTYPTIKTTGSGTITQFQTSEGKIYDIHHTNPQEYSFKILQFKKAFRHKSLGVQEREFTIQDKALILKEFNYKRYFYVPSSAEEHKHEATNRKSIKFVKSKLTIQDLKRDYEFDNKCLGSGSFGSVFLATNKSDRTFKFAVKQINISEFSGDDLEMLENEIKVMQTVDHPNIVKYYETFYDEPKKQVYLCMELCSGGDFFQKVVDQGKTLTEEEAAVQFEDVLKAIVHCHSANIMHRDIKPDNMMIGDGGQVKLVDFGFAIVCKKKKQELDVKGTPYYIAPEVLKRSYGKQCDIWSLGVVLYELLTGDVPFDAASIQEIFAKINLGKFQTPKGLSKNCVDLLKRMICVDQNKRITARDCLNHQWFVQNLEKRGRQSTQSGGLDKSIIEALINFKGRSVLKRAALHILVQGLKPNQVKYQQKQFQILDTDLSGYIEPNELKEGIRNSNVNITESDIEEIIQQLDYNGNGKINNTDFISATIDVSQYLKNERLEAIFNEFDIDKTRIITEQNMKDAFTKFGRKIKADELLNIIREHDTDGEAGISFEEFKELMLEHDN